jgi:hypothetical protein
MRDIMKSKYDKYVHSWRKKFVVAEYDESAHQYRAFMTKEGRRLTGCNTVFAPNLDGIGLSSTVYGPYTTRATALRMARGLYGEL